MNIGELTATIDVDPAPAEAGLAQAEAAMEGFTRGADGRLRDLRGRFVSESALMGQALADGVEHGTEAVAEHAEQAGHDLADGLGGGGEDAAQRLIGSLSDAELAVHGFTRSADGRIRDLRGRFVSESATIGEALEHALGDAGQHGAERLEEGAGRARGALRDSGDEGNRLSQILGGVGSAIGSALFSKISLIASGIGSAIPAAAGLAAALVNILPAAGIAATGLLMVASAGAAIKIGASGIGTAIKAAFADAPASAGAATNSAKQYADAQRTLKDTIENAAYANAQAVQHVADAERNLTDAQKAALQAQQALDDARKQAALDLEDLNNRVIDSALGQRSATLRVQDAKNTLDQTLADPKATELQRQQAQLAYDEAVQHLREQGIAYERLQQQQIDATRAGVEGSQKVVQAQDRIAQTQRQVGDQTRALQDAQTQQARTAAQGAEQVQKAIEALHQAGASAASGGVDPLAAALAKLSPNARAFVEEIIRLKPALADLKFDVQQSLFQGFAGSLREGATSILPVLHGALVTSAQHLNTMGREVISTASGLASSGVLGRALAAANAGLGSLTRLPSVFVQGLVQIGAAAGPAFERINAAAGRGLDKLSAKMTAAFNSGGMEKAIDVAVDLIGQLGHVVGNLGKFLSEVLGSAQQSGGGFVATLVTISGALAAAFADPAIQSGLQALFKVTAAVASTAAPLLVSALKVIGPVLDALGPPVQVLLDQLGSQGLQPIISALGPVLLAGAKAVGQLVLAASPLLGLIGSLVSLALPALTPLLNGAEQVFRQLAPVVGQLATALLSLLGPILAQLPVLIKPTVDIFTTLTGQLLPILTQLLTELPIADLGKSFGELAVALAPVLAQFATMIANELGVLMPLLIPIISTVAQLATVLVSVLAQGITKFVVPVLHAVTEFLSGDMAGAWRSVKDAASGFVDTVVSVFTDLPGRLDKIFSDLTDRLYDAGKSLIDALIRGMKAVAGSTLTNAVGGIVGTISDFFPHSPAKRGPFSGSGWTYYSGLSIGTDFARGLTANQDRVRQATASLMGTAGGGLGLGQLAGPAGAFAGAGGAGFHIDNYYEAPNGDARRTAAELAYLGRGRG